MTLSDLAALGSFVSGIAVVVTLIFLLLQMRQANRYQRAAMQLGRAARVQSGSSRTTNPEIVSVIAKAMNCDGSLSEVETRIWINSVAADMQNYEDTFLQYRAGFLERASMGADEAVLRTFMTSPGYRAAWQLISIAFGEEFRVYVNGIMEKVEPLPAGELSPVYKMAVREHLARVRKSPLDLKDTASALAFVQGATKVDETSD